MPARRAGQIDPLTALYAKYPSRLHYDASRAYREIGSIRSAT
jgi:hypothetical protein